jgi:hypothetical protein
MQLFLNLYKLLEGKIAHIFMTTLKMWWIQKGAKFSQKLLGTINIQLLQYQSGLTIIKKQLCC